MGWPTPIADMIAEMLKNCIPIETIIVAVRSMERAASTRQGVDETAEKRRAWDREYRRNKRGRTSERPPDPPDFHPKPPDVGSAAISSVEAEEGLSMKEDKKNKQESKKVRSARGTKIPPDWRPNERHYAEGASRGMSRADVDERATAMREWCGANENRAVTTKANWDLAFMGTWVKQANRHGGKFNGTAQTKPGVVAVAKRLAEQFESQSGDGLPGNPDAVLRISQG